MTMFIGTEGVKTYTAIVLKVALKLYANTGMKVNSKYTPTAMLKEAGVITGKKFKRGQYMEAHDALVAWVRKNGTTGN